MSSATSLARLVVTWLSLDIFVQISEPSKAPMQSLRRCVFFACTSYQARSSHKFRRISRIVRPTLAVVLHLAHSLPQWLPTIDASFCGTYRCPKLNRRDGGGFDAASLLEHSLPSLATFQRNIEVHGHSKDFANPDTVAPSQGPPLMPCKSSPYAPVRSFWLRRKSCRLNALLPQCRFLAGVHLRRGCP